MPLHHHDYFNDKSDLYASARPRYPDELFEFLCSLCPDLDRAWDCATGSGQAALSLAARFRQVEATDVSPEQIRHAPAHEWIHYSVQVAEATDFPDDAFSLVTVAQALHWFDLDRFWPEVQRVLKPGGIFAAWAYTWLHVSDEIDQVIKTKLLDVIKSYWAPQNRLAWAGYRNVSFPFIEIQPPEIKLVLHWNIDQLLSYLGTWSATRRCIEENGDDFFAELAAALGQVWGSPEQQRAVAMIFHLRVGRQEA